MWSHMNRNMEMTFGEFVQTVYDIIDEQFPHADPSLRARAVAEMLEKGHVQFKNPGSAIRTLQRVL